MSNEEVDFSTVKTFLLSRLLLDYHSEYEQRLGFVTQPVGWTTGIPM